jgi:hypothetical protein
MNDNLIKYKDDVTRVFGLMVDVLNVSRSLNTVSLDLKLLAINGIVQAAKIGNKQGQSLITLSGFLSDLPSQIAPELNDLEELSGSLSKEITICSIAVRRFILYSISLSKSYDQIRNDLGIFVSADINLMNAKELINLKRNNAVLKAPELSRENILILAQKNLSLINILTELLSASQAIIVKSKNKIEKIRRNGFIANYMGSNISIEAAYLSRDHRNFIDLVQNIKEIVQILNDRLDDILYKIDEGDKLLHKLIVTGIIQ